MRSPKTRFVPLAECGTHVLFGTHMGSYTEGELSLAKKVLESLKIGMRARADHSLLATSCGSGRLRRVIPPHDLPVAAGMGRGASAGGGIPPRRQGAEPLRCSA